MSILRLGLIRRVVDNKSGHSVSTALRRRRMDVFHRLIQDKDRPVRVLDVGGTEAYWRAVGIPDGLRIVLLNQAAPDPVTPGMEGVAGDARDMSVFGDRTFDVVFSNSVIEHVGTFRDQTAMAREVQRVGRAYFVQTPNRYFPIEPHFLFPGFQFLPVGMRARLHNRWNLGWMSRAPSLEAARREVEQVRLLTRRELQALFPDASIHVERFAGVPKSYVAYGVAEA
jgi:hypothetical protein